MKKNKFLSINLTQYIQEEIEENIHELIFINNEKKFTEEEFYEYLGNLCYQIFSPMFFYCESHELIYGKILKHLNNAQYDSKVIDEDC